MGIKFKRRTIVLENTEALNKWTDENVEYDHDSNSTNFVQSGKVILEAVTPMINSISGNMKSSDAVEEGSFGIEDFKYIVTYLERV